VRIATYNLRAGGSHRTHWVRLIEAYAVDLLLVQESLPPAEHLPRSLSAVWTRTAWAMVKRNGWGSAVHTTTGSLRPVPVPGFRGWVVGAEVTGAAWQPGPNEPLLVFSVHAPSGRGSYAKIVNALLDKIRRLAKGRELVLGGDFNLTVGIGCQTGRPVRKENLAIQARLADEFGLVNCWQATNPGRPLPQTLRWTTNPTVPYHCDGIFVPKAWASRLVACDVLAGGDWDRLSDHNPVIARLGEQGSVQKT
jgi:endonuclease/exonuclease/phosphatase family metal-dependent hydrolase